MPKASKARKSPAFRQSRNGLREAVLGLLAIRPMSGYDLSRSYRRALQQIWYAPLGQIYPTLRTMQRDGLLRVTVKVQHDRPNRKVYNLTSEGRTLLVMWLSQPAVLPRMHHEFIHKLFLLGNVEPRRAELVDAYIKRSTRVTELRRAELVLEPSLKGPVSPKTHGSSGRRSAICAGSSGAKRTRHAGSPMKSVPIPGPKGRRCPAGALSVVGKIRHLPACRFLPVGRTGFGA